MLGDIPVSRSVVAQVTELHRGTPVHSGALAHWAKRGGAAVSWRDALYGSEKEELRAREQEESHVHCTGEGVEEGGGEGRSGGDMPLVKGDPAHDRERQHENRINERVAVMCGEEINRSVMRDDKQDSREHGVGLSPPAVFVLDLKPPVHMKPPPSMWVYRKISLTPKVERDV